MSLITLQFGQCGNQVGQSLYSEIYADIGAPKTGVSKRENVDYVTETTAKWFHVPKRDGAWEARSILIDTESKVTANADPPSRAYKFPHVVSKARGGSANNWAYGYSKQSEKLLSDIHEAVRKEAERSDFVTELLALFSSAGGTGSGVGSRTIESLHDLYPSKSITPVVVLPYKEGEVVTQAYNSLLTLSKIYDVCDALCLYENDALHWTCAKSLARSPVTLDDLNSLIAQQLTVALEPRAFASLAGNPHHKLVQLTSAPHVCSENLKYESGVSWSVLIKRIKSAAKVRSEGGAGLRCVGNILVTRGELAAGGDLGALEEPALYVPWVPREARLVLRRRERRFRNLSKFGALASNNNLSAKPLDDILGDAWRMFTNKAYLHHYQQFGIGEEAFGEAFNKLETVFMDYRDL